MIGRFIQEDSYLGDGLNLFAYCQNNPLVYFDPTGHATDPNSWCANKYACIQFIMERDKVGIEEAEDTYNSFRNKGWNKFRSAAEIRERLMGGSFTESIGSTNILHKDISEWTNEELQQAVDSIHYAQYKDKKIAFVNNPIALSRTKDGRIIISKNGGVPSTKSREMARIIFGDDVVFVQGSEYDYATDAGDGYHAEARGIQYMRNNGIDTNEVVMVCSHYSCGSVAKKEGCTYKQLIHGINNQTGSKEQTGVVGRDYDTSNLWIL